MTTRGGPARTDLLLEIRDKNVGENSVTSRVGQNRVRVVCSHRLVRAGEITRVEDGLGADVRDVVVLSNKAMESLDAHKPVVILVLGCKMAEDKYSGLIGAHENRAN